MSDHIETVVRAASTAGATAKAAVPVGTGLMIFDVITQPIAVVLGIVYTLAMLAHLLWKWNKEYHEYRRKTKDSV